MKKHVKLVGLSIGSKVMACQSLRTLKLHGRLLNTLQCNDTDFNNTPTMAITKMTGIYVAYNTEANIPEKNTFVDILNLPPYALGMDDWMLVTYAIPTSQDGQKQTRFEL